MKRKNRERKVGKLENSLKNLSLKEKILLLITTLIVIFIILNFAVIKPLGDENSNLNQEITSLKIKNLTEMNSNKTNNSLINKYTITQNKYISLTKEFKSTTQYKLVETILGFAKNSGVTTQNISFSKGVPNKEYKDIIKNTGVIDVKGQYENIVSFLKLLEANKKALIINGVDIYNNNIDGLKSGEFTGEIKISYFNVQKDLKKDA